MNYTENRKRQMTVLKTKKTEIEKMIAGEDFVVDDHFRMVEDRTYDLMLKFNNTGERKYLEEMLVDSPENLVLRPPFYCAFAENIKLGKNVYINFNCSFLACAPIEIGDRTWIAPNVQIYTPNHEIDPDKRLAADSASAKPVKIGNNCWIGGGSIILGGVTIGDGVTIGAGSVVTKDIPARSIAVGSPCRVIKSF